ncbi:uncharacterized protein CANTADRAFT_31634, partial [Suhomyces tanzawaensis NRRL Y-17324]
LALLKTRLVASKPTDLQKSSLDADYAALLHLLHHTYTSGSSDDQWFILLNDSLAVCLLRMAQHSRNSLSAFEVLQDQITAILDYVIRYVNHKSAPLINSLTALVTKAISFYTISSKEQLHDSLQLAIPKILSQKLTKNLFNVLELVIRSLPDKQKVLQKHPEIPRMCIEAAGDDQVANSASKTFVTLFTGLYNAQDGTNTWYALWRDLVLEGLSDEKTRYNLVTYLLPYLVQPQPSTLSMLISEYSGPNINKDLSSMDIIMNLYKLAQEKSISFELPSNISSFLNHYDPKIRLNALSLVLGGSAKNSKSLPIPDETYQIIRESRCIDTFMNDYEDIESRNKFVSLITHFLGFRFKESMYSLNKEFGKLIKKDIDPDRQQEIAHFLESGNLFIDWLIENLTAYLNPASNYSQLITAIQLLASISSKLSDMKNCNIYRDKLIHFLIQNLFNNYENIREMSFDLLTSCDPAVIDNFFESSQLQAQLVNQSYTILTSLTGRKSDGAAKFFEFLTIYHLNMNAFDKITRIIDSMIVRMSYGINLLKEGSNLERSEIYIHGYFKSMNLMLNRLTSSHLDYIKMISATIIDLIFDIWTLVEPILSNSSLEDEEDVIDDDKILLNYAWKVIKDSNILLSHILSMNVVDEDMFLRCSELIMTQLSSVKHKGAFSSIYPSFISTCEMCFKSADLKHYPFKWLKENLKLIESKEQFISRRSGGIPFLITGILVNENDAPVERHILLQYSFDYLLSVAERPFFHDSKNDIPQVHAFNCIKQIFNETTLSRESLDYVETSLVLALSNFHSENWSIRNCAVMLFGTIQRRIFGTRNESRYPYKLFFERFPQLDQILHKELCNVLEEDSAQDIFPVIIILLKLDTSSVADVSILAKYKPLLVRLLANKYWKIREMLANCISTFFSDGELFELSMRFFGHQNEGSMDFISKIEDLPNLNEAQGYLRVISESYSRLSLDDKRKLKQATLNKLEYVLANYQSPYIVKAFLDIIVQFNEQIPSESLDLLGNYLVNLIVGDDDRLDGGKQLVMAELIGFLLTNYQKYYLNDDKERTVDLIRLGLACTDAFRVQESTIEYIKLNFEMLKSEVVHLVAEDLIELIGNGKNFDYVRAQGLGLYSKILEEGNAINLTQSKRFIAFLDPSFTEDIQLNSLKCLASLALQLLIADQDRFIDECRQLCDDSKSFKYRLTAIESLVKGHSTFKLSENLQKSRMETLLVFRGLYDDDESIRGIAAGYLSSYLGMSVKTNPSSLANQCLPLLLSKGGQFKRALVEEFQRHTLDVNEVEKLDSSTIGETLFDVENSNLYINKVE